MATSTKELSSADVAVNVLLSAAEMLPILCVQRGMDWQMMENSMTPNLKVQLDPAQTLANIPCLFLRRVHGTNGAKVQKMQYLTVAKDAAKTYMRT